MKKQEALDVMHEVLGTLQESVIISGVSLDRRSSRISKDPQNEGFIIRMRCDLDNYSADCLKLILERHSLVMEAENGFVVFSKSCR